MQKNSVVLVSLCPSLLIISLALCLVLKLHTYTLLALLFGHPSPLFYVGEGQEVNSERTFQTAVDSCVLSIGNWPEHEQKL